MMKRKKLEGIDACVFDAYGTLFDVHSAVGRYTHRLGDQASGVSDTWRTKQLQYTWLRSLMGRHEDFWQVTGQALDYAFQMHGVDDDPLKKDLMAAYLSLDCYPEVPGVLAALKGAGFTCAILSNGTPVMLEAAVKSAGIEAHMDRLLSVEAVGIYKPDPRVYQMGPDLLGVSADRIVFMSSNAWDASGAAAFGFHVAWVNRFGQAPERLPGDIDAEITTLSELPALLGR
jgi:2-haloacid dehalogenase